MKKIFFLLLLCAVCTGCFSTKRLDPAVMQQMNGKTICPAFMPAQRSINILTSGEAVGLSMGGIVGAVIAEKSNNLNNGRIAEHYGIEDPSKDVADNLSAMLAAQYKLTKLPAVSIESDEAKPDEIIRAATSDYILCAQTVSWGFSYYPRSWNRYLASVHMQVRLIDGKSGEVLAQTQTGANSDISKDQAPTYKQLFDNNAQKMKDLLQPFPAVLTPKFNEKMFTVPPSK